MTVETSQIQDEFSAKGYVILRGFFESRVVEAARREIEHWVDREASQFMANGTIDQLHEKAPFETRLIRLVESGAPSRKTIRQELHLPGMFGLFFHRALLDVVEIFLGPEIRLYPNYSVRPKLPDDPMTQVLWHQDAGYTASGQHGRDTSAGGMTEDQLRMINIWTPLVPARPENGCMQFIPGTHKLGIVPHVDRGHYLEIVEDALKPYLDDALDIAVDPGDVVLFSNLLFHMGQPNKSPTIRWSCDWRYQDARQSTMHAERGHIARSRSSPESAVKSADQWAEQMFV